MLFLVPTARVILRTKTHTYSTVSTVYRCRLLSAADKTSKVKTLP